MYYSTCICRANSFLLVVRQNSEAFAYLGDQVDIFMRILQTAFYNVLYVLYRMKLLKSEIPIHMESQINFSKFSHYLAAPLLPWLSELLYSQSCFFVGLYFPASHCFEYMWWLSTLLSLTHQNLVLLPKKTWCWWLNLLPPANHFLSFVLHLK